MTKAEIKQHLQSIKRDNGKAIEGIKSQKSHLERNVVSSVGLESEIGALEAANGRIEELIGAIGEDAPAETKKADPKPEPGK